MRFYSGLNYTIYNNWTIIFLLILTFLTCLTGCESIDNAAKSSPNIILIVVDDQGYADLSCAQLTNDVHTPNMDKLASRGVRFTQAYATSPICSPSRAGLITGCYHQRWGQFWYGGKGIHDPYYNTLAELLSKNDYLTGYIGKVHYGSFDGDTTNRNFPLNHGFDYYFGHTSARKHYMNHKQDLENKFQEIKKSNNKKGQSLRQQPLWLNNSKIDTIAFSTELFGKKACEFIEQNKDEKFFLQLSFNAVHNFTHQLPKEYLNKMGLAGYHDWDPAREEYYEWYKAARYPNNKEGREQYLGQLFYLDQEIGRVIDKLEDLDMTKNTIIIYISDNGGSTPIYANNTPLRGSKYVLYEGGIRVPMIISWPGYFSEDITVSNIVSSMDILPTVCKALNIEPNNKIDGLDLTPLLKMNDKSLAHDTLYWDTGHETAVRAGKWKYRSATNDNNARYEMVEIELGEFLYNLETDPGEKINLINEYPHIYSSLKDSHSRWRNSITKKK